MTRCLLVIGVIALAGSRAEAHWLLNFSTAQTVKPGKVAFIGGTGGQLTDVGDPSSLSFTPFLAHAGLRVGLTDRLDIGYRLVTVPLPYSSVGPSLGSAADLKLRVTPDDSHLRVALIAGGGVSYLHISGKDRFAWSPGGAVVLSHPLGEMLEPALDLRYVYTAIPTAPGGSAANNVTAVGGSVALKVRLTASVSVIPEVGLFRFSGEIAHVSTDGIGAQYGAVLSCVI